MKTTVKTAVQTAKNGNLSIIEGTTKSGKKCLAILTDLRLSKEDYLSLKKDVLIGDGYFFQKYYPEHDKSLISVVNMDEKTLNALASAYVWSKAEPKEAKPKKTGKASNTPKGKQTPNIEAMTKDDALALLAKLAKQFQ